MTVAVTLRSRVSDVARKGFEKSTTAIRLQVWVRSAAITSISLKVTLMEIFVNFQATSRWTIPMSPVQLPGSSSTPYWESSLSTIEKSNPWTKLAITRSYQIHTPCIPDSRQCGWADPKWSPGSRRRRGRRERVELPQNPPSGEVSSDRDGDEIGGGDWFWSGWWWWGTESTPR